MARKRRSRTPEEEEDHDDVDVENRENHQEEEEEDDNEGGGDGGDRRTRKKKKKQKKFQIMTSSGQTENDRRTLRRRQRELNADIAIGASSSRNNNNAAGEGEGADDPDGELQRLREQNNELWEDVRYTREAVLDSENVDLIASKAARQAEKIVQVPRYDAIRLAQSLVKKGSVRIGSSSQFNWRGLGFQVGVCFNALPAGVSFLYGPLDAEYAPKERKKAERRKKFESEAAEEEEPDDMDQTGKKESGDGNELSAVEAHIKVIGRTLRKRSEHEQEAAIERADEYETQLSQEIDDPHVVQKKKKRFIRENSQVSAVNCLFNPKSFTQTVENVFHFSFLVKAGKTGIKTRSAEEVEEYGGIPGPVIRPVKDGVDPGIPKQAIVSLNMKDWKDMCKAYHVEESDVPHREHGKVAAKKEKKEKKR